jgi:hypothetical protein
MSEDMEWNFVRRRTSFPDDPEMERISGIMFDAEVEKFGIADGMMRRPIDPDYAHEPAYLSGHRTGMRLPQVPDHGDP